MNIVKHIIIFLLIYFTYETSSLAVTSDEIIDLEKNESQIEFPPLSITTDNTPNVLEETKSSDERGDAISQNSNPLEQTESISSNNNEIPVADEHQQESQTNEKNDDIVEQTAEEDKKRDEEEVAQENLTIPVFSEWTQMQQLQEKEKKLVELTNSSETNKESKNETLAKHQISKQLIRQKNYASPDCGAKILQSNPEAQSPSSVLSGNKDEYMLSPCTDRIWFVVELCDSIQAQRVELANFELFSSPLKSVSISVSNRYPPAREWTLAGHFESKSERDVQNYELKDVSLFGKFVRVDLQYTNTEHYCPLSFFRIFGTSEIEAFEVENEPDGSMNSLAEENFMHDQQHLTEMNKKSNDANKDNILNRAGAAVLSMVQKAAEVLVKGNGHGVKPNATNQKQFTEKCMSMSHNILCESCSHDERDNLHNFIGCKNFALTSLLKSNEDIKNHLINTLTCHAILGFGLKNDAEIVETNRRNFLISILPQRYIAAMCNMIAKDLKALTLRIENIPEISSNLIPKKDEVSLKNISKKEEECKQPTSTEVVTPSPIPVVDLTQSPQPAENEDTSTKEAEAATTSTTSTTTSESAVKESVENSNDENIFNHVDCYERAPEGSELVIEKPPIEVTSTEAPVIEKPNSKEITPSKETHLHANSKPIEILPIETKPVEEIKTNGDHVRASNAPESVFLRLSNRIKILEKNMTLSTQYLEELSRRYKKQIEDLQTSYSKLQVQFDSLNQNKKENDLRNADEKSFIKSMISELDSRAQYMEIILIILSTFLLLQTILVIVLFKRMSILRTEIDSNSSSNNYDNLQPVVDSETANGSVINVEKSRNGRKRSKQRVRKISAPNILSQRGMKNDVVPSVPPAVLNRTVSAPNKVSEMIEIRMKENNFSTMQQAPMLEENDDIFIPGFEDLKISDEDHEYQQKAGAKEDYEEDTASTASVKTESQKSFDLRRRLSSPTNFLKLKRSSMKTNGRGSENYRSYKAKSESPPKISNSFSSSGEGGGADSPFKTRKNNNSFKKLFKKLF